jgi:serpin B
MEYGLVSLNEALQNLGMKSAFGPEADFSMIGDNLGINEVAHKAKIQVEEWGTKAAAATGIEVYTTAIRVSEPINFIVEKPFIFFIRDKKSGSILFMGEMDQFK